MRENTNSMTAIYFFSIEVTKFKIVLVLFFD